MADDKPGHYHLAEGVIAALRRLREVEVTRVRVKRKWIVPTRYLRHRLSARTYWPPRMLRMAYRIQADDLPKADLVLSAGGETLMPNICAARHLGVPNIFCGSLVHRLASNDLTLVISSYKCDAADGQHLVVLKPSAIDPARLSRPALAAQYGTIRHPQIAGLLLGGNAGALRYRRFEWKRILQFAADVSREWGTRWFVSTSRRTPKWVSKLVSDYARHESVVAKFIDYRKAGPGTLLQIFEAAQVIACTEDSSSMISEAIAARIPVIALRPRSFHFNAEEKEYRDFLYRENWYRVLLIAEISPFLFASRLDEIAPMQQNSLDLLAAKLQDRLPQLLS